jgi:hypothetical protein
MCQWPTLIRRVEEPWLLIFDNAANTSLVLEFWPKIGNSGAILITTRDPFFAQPDIAGDGQELLQLDEESAIALVRSSVPRPTGDSQEYLDAQKLVRRVGCMPLALRTCIGQMTEAGCTISQYQRNWDTRQIISESNIKHVNMRNAPYSKSLIDVLATSLASLDDVTRSLFEVLSLLDAEKIPEDLFENEELKSQIPFLKVRFKCISELMTSSLIGNEGNPGAGEIRYFHMHELWNDFTREETKGASRQQAFDWATLLLDAKIWIGKQSERVAQLEQYFDHVASLFEYACQYSTSRQGELGEDKIQLSVTFISLIRRMSWYVSMMDWNPFASNR